MSIFAQKHAQQGTNIVLVHGAWADGSSWSAVIERLQADGYNVTAPQFPMTTLADNVARLRQVLARQNGPTISVFMAQAAPKHPLRGPLRRVWSSLPHVHSD